MVREFTNEQQALAISNSLDLHITKKNGVYIVGNDALEICERYGMRRHLDVFYDAEMFHLCFSEIRTKYLSIVDASSIEIPYGLKNCALCLVDAVSLECLPESRMVSNPVIICLRTASL